MTIAQKPRVVTRAMSLRATPPSTTPASLMSSAAARGNDRITIKHQALSALKLAPRRVRRRGKGQVEALAANIERFEFVMPIPVTGTGEIVDGHAVLEACRRLKHETIPTIVVDHLSEPEIKALRLSLNKLANRSEWDMEALAEEFEELFALDPSLLPFTAFTMPEIDLTLSSFGVDVGVEPEAPPLPAKGAAVSRLGDLWLFEGGHKLFNGSARESASYEVLLGSEKVQMVLTDPPYGCAIKGHVSRSHGEFVEGSGLGEGEMSAFFQDFLGAMIGHLADGAIADIFIDGHGMFALLQAIRAVGLEQKALVTWDKGAGGMGSLYRQQAEFVVVTKSGKGPHINNVELGRHGRNRTTVWSAPGLAQFGKGRKEALRLHPTVKPVSLLMDALLDTSHPGGIILDPFAGSGTLLLAAHRTHRVGRAIELDPGYVDVAVARMEALTGHPTRHAATGLTFAEMAVQRQPGSGEGADARPVRS